MAIEEPGEYTINEFHSQAIAIREAKEWRLFQFCLREWGRHPTCRFLQNSQISRRTRIDPVPMNEGNYPWRLTLIVRESKSSLWDTAQVIEKPVDKLD
jgi:hypothetical protein